MKLPRRGVLVQADGKILWAWNHANPDTEFDSLPPRMEMADGSVIIRATPDAVVIDCEAEFTPDDIPLLYRNMEDVRVRKGAQLKWEFFQQISALDAQGNIVVVEVPHPIEAIRAARKKAKERKP